MGLLDRVRNIVRANVNDALRRAQNPEKAVDQMIADMNEELVKVRQSAALAISSQNRLEAEYEQRAQAAREWQRRAELAVDKGDDDLAKQALRRKLQYQKEANQLHQSVQAQASQIDQMKARVQELDERVQNAQMQRNQLIARFRTAEATRILEEQTASSGKFRETMQQLETRTSDAEAQAAAYHELNHDSVEDRFAALEAGSSNVDDELETLKKQRLLGDGNG